MRQTHTRPNVNRVARPSQPPELPGPGGHAAAPPVRFMVFQLVRGVLLARGNLSPPRRG